MRRLQLRASRWLNRKLTRLSTTRLIALVFAAIILTGTLLLMTPAASRSGVSCSFRGALFTATSATCVTGLTLFDTWSQWSAFGQAVILALIEIGGLGFMSAASIFVFVLRRRVGMKQRLVMAQSLSVDDMSSVVDLQKVVLKGSLFASPNVARYASAALFVLVMTGAVGKVLGAIDTAVLKGAGTLAASALRAMGLMG